LYIQSSNARRRAAPGLTARRVLWAAANSSSAHAPLFSKCHQIVEKEEKQGAPPEKVAELIAGIVEGRAHGLRYTCGHPSQRLSAVLKRLLPGSLFQSIIASFYGLGVKK
jgi:hypothetical protein